MAFKTCPLCGKKLFKLLSLPIKDSSICPACYARVQKASAMNDLSRMKLKEAQNFLSAKAFSDAQTDCACCGGPLGGKGSDIKLKTGEKLCGSCADRLRIVCPLIHTVEEDADGDEVSVTVDPLNDMTPQEARSAMDSADRERALRRKRFGSCGAAFEVDGVQRTYSMAPGSGKPSAVYYAVKGRVLLGCVRLGDTLIAARSDGTASFKVAALMEKDGPKSAKYLKEGSQGVIAVEGEVTQVFPGDVVILN